jgi:type IV pilus assembly protein PilW
MNHTNQRFARRSRGVTLIELMIAMTIGLMVIAGIGYIYLQGREGYRVQDSQSRLQEDVRFATEAVTREFRNARYFACIVPSDPQAGKLTPSYDANIRFTGAHPWFTYSDAIPPSTTWLVKPGTVLEQGNINVSYVLRGFDDGNGWPNTAALADRLKPNTDVLMFMRTADEARMMKEPGSYDMLSEFEIVGDPLPGVKTDGRLATLAVSSCARGTEIVKATVKNGGRKFSLDNTYNVTKGLDGEDVSYLRLEVTPKGTMVSRFEPVAYYIVRDDRNKTKLPALYRVTISDMTPAAIEKIQTGVWDTNGGELVIAGVDNMQLRYLVDGQYRTATDINLLGDANVHWQKVRAIEVTLTIISEDDKVRTKAETQTLLDSSTVNDRRIRQEVRFVVGVANSGT